MVKGLKYVIKRIIIGIGIALALMYIKGNLLFLVNAQTVSYDVPLTYASINSTGYGSTSGLPPLRQSYGNYLSTVFYNGGNYIMTSGNSYYIYYVVELSAKDFSVTNNQIDFYVTTSNNNNIHGYPDREVYTYLYNTGTNTYTLVYMFGLDVTVNVTTMSFQFNYYSDYTSDFTQSGIDKATLTIVLPDDNSSGGGSSTIVDFQPVIVNQIQNTQTLINNQNQNTQSIISNNNENTQDIIDNQNANTDKEIASQKVCKIYDKSSVFTKNKFLASDGSLRDSNYFGISDYIRISSDYDLSAFNNSSGTGGSYYCFYDSSKTLISCNSNYSLSLNTNINIPSNSNYVRFSFYLSNNSPRWKLCANGNQSLEDSLTDDSGVSDSDISDLFGDLQESHSPVSDLLTLPITLLQAYLTGFDSTCSAYNLGSLYGTNLILPCIDIPQYIGSGLWSLIDALCCIYMIYNIAMLFVSVYEAFTSLDDSMQLLYTPQHSGHTRVSRNEGEY